MKRLLLVTGTAVLLLGSPASASSARYCDSYAVDFGEVSVKGLTCSAASKVTAAHRRSKSCAKTNADGTRTPRRCAVRGYSCSTKKIKGGTRIACLNKARTKSVRFTIYG